MHTSYWNPRTETLSREQLDALQLRKLRDLVAWTLQNAPWQAARLREAGVTPDVLRTLDDVRRIPFLTRAEWMESQIADPPFGAVLSQPREAAIRYHTTSGTTGSRPLAVLDGPKDWEWIAELWCYALWGFGIRPGDTIFFAFSYGTFVGFWGAHYAAEKLGCLVLPGGNMTTEGRVRQIVDTGTTVVCSTPTYALRMAQEAQALGIDLPGSAVSRLILSGEPAGSIPATKRLIEEQWGAKAADTAGMTEVGTIVMFECEHQPGGAHIIEDHILEEVVDPITDEPVPYGEEGERIVTSFGRGFIPLLRYRTRDLVRRVPASTCPCGRGFDIYDGGIRGRVDDMKVVRGTNVYPRAIEEIVRRREQIDEFQIHLYTVDGLRDEIEVLVECEAVSGEEDPLLRELRRELADAHEGLRIGVKLAEPESLPRFELKAKRLVDDREVWGSQGDRKAM
ncbi:phenylacetate--CoA ligase family protein [Capillimicrobium parvum]|uniref:Phenylacetate-coenzyme A ligase n=1 Tax=Capillimicrobium parvum TaxID=2884022 RepID=A0A9E6XSG1_9ACTN|nr:AMP-binding protein [Capillimicrobium parvum]UGS33896.1 Phenylacetate-coenzyme A ligase [Capillimicrobium parvum]